MIDVEYDRLDFAHTVAELLRAGHTVRIGGGRSTQVVKKRLRNAGLDTHVAADPVEPYLYIVFNKREVRYAKRG